MGIMTGAASTSIQISYSTEDGIATEEILGFGENEFLAELEDVEEYPVNYEPLTLPDPPVKDFLATNGSKFSKRPIEFELKMVTLISDNNCDGVRIVGAEDNDTMSDSNSPLSHFQQPCALQQKHTSTDLQLSDEDSSDAEDGNSATLENRVEQTEPSKAQISFESCLRESIEVCLDHSGEFDQIAEDILSDHHWKDRNHGQGEAPPEIEAKSTEAKVDSHSLVTTYDGPPTLSPNYVMEGNVELPEACRDESPPALTKEFEGVKEVVRRGRGRPPGLKRKRSSPKQPKKAKSRKLEVDSNGLESLNGKCSRKGHNKDAHALHRNSVPVVIPHSSAEIQERVKNRQRKATQSYGVSTVAEEAVPEIPEGEKPAQKVRQPRPRKLSSASSSNSSESKSRKMKSQNGLFIVEKILKKGIINGQPYFFVKWLNYPNSKNTWEPEANFSLDLIAAYERKASETGQLVKVIEMPDVSQPPPEFRSLMRSTPVKTKEKCPGCMSFPHTFTDNRRGPNGFDAGLTYHKVLESFILDEEWCALVEFAEKHCLELIPMTLINDRLKAEIKLH